MKLGNNSSSLGHLSYCSNIHAGESWREVSDNLKQYIPGIKASLSPNAAFGIGLRLSAQAATSLRNTDTLQHFKSFLHSNDCYVFTINGFPYGPFHGTRVKEEVYLPDWKDPERLRYTNELADVFAQFLPTGQTGSISTVPGAFKANIRNQDDLNSMTKLFVRHVAHLVQLEQQTGAHIVLAIEPEPCCFLETIEESVNYFTQHLFAPAACEQLAQLLNIGGSDALKLLRTHLTLCLDLCHAAVEFEQCKSCLDAINAAGITIGKLQISAGLRIKNVSKSQLGFLEPYLDSVYLHQVVEHNNGQVNRYTDLPDAIAALNENAELNTLPEWRVHFHVPIFMDTLAHFDSTQFFIREALAIHKHTPISEHLEVETYTWDVLPETLRSLPIEKAIERELTWVIDTLNA